MVLWRNRRLCGVLSADTISVSLNTNDAQFLPLDHPPLLFSGAFPSGGIACLTLDVQSQRASCFWAFVS